MDISSRLRANPLRAADDCLMCFRAGVVTMGIHVFSSRAYRLDYRVNGAHEPEPADETIHERALFQEHTAVEPVAASESERVFRVGTEATVTVDQARANVSIHLNERRAYGGVIGTADTVLAREQLILRKSGVCMYRMPLAPGTRFYGMGEKSGPLDRRGRRLKMFNRDALAYDGAISDPLYKSIPILIKDELPEGVVTAIFVPRGLIEVDLGVESTNFYSLSFDRGSFSVYVLIEEEYASLMDAITRLVGRPTLPPLFTFGYFGSSMNYVEDDDAEERVDLFLEAIEEKQIPCEGIYLSSGYVKAENKKRYTFVWNRRRFPNPEAFLGRIRAKRLEVCANIKPGFLVTHPWYTKLKAKGYFVPKADGEAAVTYYWGSDASLFDCTNPEARSWWKERLREISSAGVTGIWNDNNEYEIEGIAEHAGKEAWCYTRAMCDASFELLCELHPDRRPWVITRAGGYGMQTVARTWTGDNVSTFDSMRWGSRIGLGLGLSGVPFYGHDIGGFAGPQPDPELLLRWCQTAVLQPRFAIHSWNDEGEPTELWSFPEWEQRLIRMVRRHYEFLPTLYDLAIKAARSGAPIQRPLFYEFPHDEGARRDTGNHLVGPSLLNVVDFYRGSDCVEVYLPEGARWYLPDDGCLIPGGRTIELDYGFDHYRYFQRAGSAVVTSPGLNRGKSGFFPRLDFFLAPDPDGDELLFTHLEDDGITPSAVTNRYTVRLSREHVHIQSERTPETANSRHFTLSLPRGFVFADREACRTLLINAAELTDGVEAVITGEYRPPAAHP